MTRCAIDKGIEVFHINRGNRSNLFGDSVKTLKCDVKNKAALKKLLKALYFDVIIDFIIYDLETMKVRSDIYNKHCSQFIFISSTAVFTNTNDRLTEDSPKRNINWSYSRRKLECEEYLYKNVEKFSYCFTIVRPSITYDKRRLPYPAVTKRYYWSLVSRIMNGKPILMCDDGNALRTLTSSMDFAVGVVGLFKNESAKNEDFNVVGDYYASWNQVIGIIEDYLKNKAKVIYVTTDILSRDFVSERAELMWDKSKSQLFDNKKIKSVVIDFSSKSDVRQGIFGVLDYLNSNTENLNTIDRSWDNTIDVLCAKYDERYKQLSNCRKIIIYWFQEKVPLRYIGRALRRLDIWKW